MLLANFQPTVSSAVVVHTLFTHSGPRWCAHDNEVSRSHALEIEKREKKIRNLHVMWKNAAASVSVGVLDARQQYELFDRNV